MNLPEKIYVFRLDETSSTNSVTSVLDKFKLSPKSSRESELLEGSAFGKCLEIWCNQEVFITLVDEEKTNYKGIDFFLCAKNNIKHHVAFQLLEYKIKFLGIKNTTNFADWIIQKKFDKGDKKIHLLVTVASNIPFHLDLIILLDKLKDSPFSSITLMGPTIIRENPNEFGHILVGLCTNSFQTIIDIKNNHCSYAKTLEAIIKRDLIKMINFRKILILSFSFIFIGILIGFFIDRYQIRHIRKQNEKLLNQINKSMKNLDSLDKEIKTLNDKEFEIDSTNGQLLIK